MFKMGSRVEHPIRSLLGLVRVVHCAFQSRPTLAGIPASYPSSTLRHHQGLERPRRSIQLRDVPVLSVRRQVYRRDR